MSDFEQSFEVQETPGKSTNWPGIQDLPRRSVCAGVAQRCRSIHEKSRKALYFYTKSALLQNATLEVNSDKTAVAGHLESLGFSKTLQAEPWLRRTDVHSVAERLRSEDVCRTSAEFFRTAPLGRRATAWKRAGRQPSEWVRPDTRVLAYIRCDLSGRREVCRRLLRTAQ